MTTPPDAPTPLVSVIIPVFNSVSYLAETLDSMHEQGLSPVDLEVITVDDGSDDGSERMLDDYARRYANFRVIHQPPSGGPASPCNVGAYAARGRYFFILGSDDVLTPNAMRDLAGIAEREGSDIVLGRLGSIGGRRTPGAVFAKTVYDADLVENHVFNTLSAVKLFRTELLHRTGALHPTSLRIGSDQPFVATLFLAAGKVSICADRDYVLIRTREDGTNITSTRRTPRDYMDLLVLLIPVIVERTEPGAFRDGLLRRPFRNTLTKSMRTGFLALDEATQQRVVDQLRETITPLYNEATAAHLDVLTRTKVELALDGDVEALREVMAWETKVGRRRLVQEDDGFFLDLPAGLRRRIGDHRMHAVEVTGDITLTGLSEDGAVLRVAARAIVLGTTEPASAIILRLVNRRSEETVEVESADSRRVDTDSGAGRDVSVTVDMRPLAHGVWDAYLVQKFGGIEVVTRFGAKRRNGISAEPLSLVEDAEGGAALGKVYFTRGAGNLSLDLGFTQTRNDLPEVEVRGRIEHADGSIQVLLSVVSERSPTFSTADGGPAPELSHAELGGDLHLIGVSAARGAGIPALVVRAGDRERTVVLGGTPRISRPVPVDSLDGLSAKQILRDSLRGLHAVGRRAIRRAAGRDRPGKAS